MADLDTQLITNGPLGHAISTTLRAIIAGGATSILTALGVGLPRHALVAGAAAGNVAVAAIKAGDQLDEVLYFVGAGTAVTDVSDLTGEFTITANGTINNTGGTASTGGKLLVRWTKKTA